MNKEQAQALRKPFPKEQIQSLPARGQGSAKLDYVSHAWVTDRLLEVDPEWSWKPVAFATNGLPQFDENGGLWIELTVCGVTRLGYGEQQKHLDPFDTVKSTIGNALRNAGMRFGIALDLWAKEAPAEQPKTAPKTASKPAPEQSAARAKAITDIVNAITTATDEATLNDAATQIGKVKSSLQEDDLQRLRQLWADKKVALTEPVKVGTSE